MACCNWHNLHCISIVPHSSYCMCVLVWTAVVVSCSCCHLTVIAVSSSCFVCMENHVVCSSQVWISLRRCDVLWVGGLKLKTQLSQPEFTAHSTEFTWDACKVQNFSLCLNINTFFFHLHLNQGRPLRAVTPWLQCIFKIQYIKNNITIHIGLKQYRYTYNISTNYTKNMPRKTTWKQFKEKIHSHYKSIKTG